MEFISSLILAQAPARQMSFLTWTLQAIGGSGTLLSAGAALVILVGAVLLIAKNSPPSVLAAYLVLLPLPVAIFICDFIRRLVKVLTLVSIMPDIKMTWAEIAGATAADLASLLFIVILTAPTYFALSVRLLTRTIKDAHEPKSAVKGAISVNFATDSATIAETGVVAGTP